MRFVFILFLGLGLVSCFWETETSEKEFSNNEELNDTIIPTNLLIGKYYCIKFNINGDLVLNHNKPQVKSFMNLYQFDFQESGNVAFENLIKFIGCGNGMLSLDSINFNSLKDSTISINLKGEFLTMDKFHLQNLYKVKFINDNELRLIKVQSVDLLFSDSISSNNRNGVITDFYSDSSIQFEERYKFGKQHGFTKSYYPDNKGLLMLTLYEKGIKLWSGFPSANRDFISPIKPFHIHVDSVYVKAPYSNKNLWYEGSFKNRDKIKRHGVHKVYHFNGQLKAKLDFDKKLITEYDSTGSILRKNEKFEEAPVLPTNYIRK